MTKAGVTRPIKWIGQRSYGGRFLMGQKEILPICIKAGALDENVPRRDLWISPHHAMYFKGMYFKDMYFKDMHFKDTALDGVLIEANNLFLGDTLGMAIHLQQLYRQNYGVDPRNSYFDSVRGAPDEVMFDVTAHYYTQSIANSFPNAPPGAPQPTIPSFVPDARSLFLGLHYSLARLPEKPMTTRQADPRVGFFTTPAFFANWQTNTSNTMRVTTNQALIVATGASIDGTDTTVPSSTPGLDAAHAAPGSACFSCHQLLDPTRSILAASNCSRRRPSISVPAVSATSTSSRPPRCSVTARRRISSELPRQSRTLTPYCFSKALAIALVSSITAEE